MGVYDHILVPIEGTETDAPGPRARRRSSPRSAARRSRCCASPTSTRATSAACEIEDAEGDLARAAELLRSRGIAVKTLLLSGEPQEVIVQQAAELRPDLIAMATHGHGWAKRMVLGSVADHLRHNTRRAAAAAQGRPGHLTAARPDGSPAT